MEIVVAWRMAYTDYYPDSNAPNTTAYYLSMRLCRCFSLIHVHRKSSLVIISCSDPKQLLYVKSNPNSGNHTLCMTRNIPTCIFPLFMDRVGTCGA